VLDKKVREYGWDQQLFFLLKVISDNSTNDAYRVERKSQFFVLRINNKNFWNFYNMQKISKKESISNAVIS